MLSLLARAARSYVLKLELTQISQNVRAYAFFTMRDILNENSDETGTLINRFSKHIAIEARRESPEVPTNIRYADYYPVTDIHYFRQQLSRIAADQLPALITFTFSYRPSADPNKFAAVLNDLDAMSMRLLEKMDEETIFRSLYAFLFLMPSWIPRLDFYSAAMKNLVQQHLGAKADSRNSKGKFLQLCFYLGLGKKQRSNQSLLAQLLENKLEEHLPEMTTLDLALVSNAAYKTSTIVHSEAFNTRLKQEVLSLPLNELSELNNSLLISFLKSMRLQRIRSKIVCEHLEPLCTNEQALEQLQSRGLVHMFAYFSENLWNKEDLTSSLIRKVLKRLSQTKRFVSYAESIRGKDLAMFLWSCSQLNCTISNSDLQHLEVVLKQKVENNEFSYYPDQLVDCCLSLWQLGLRSRSLLQEAVQAKSQSEPNRKQPKVDGRLTVLLTAAAIEEPSWKKVMKTGTAFNINAPLPPHIKAREDLKQYVHELSEESDIAEVKICSPFDGINIPGLVVRFTDFPETPVFIEIISEAQKLRFSDEPVGIVRLKTRLLEKLGHKVIVLQQKDLAQQIHNLKSLVFGKEVPKADEKEQSVGVV